jgi:hypothetical protein
LPGEARDELGSCGDTGCVEVVVAPLGDRDDVGERGAVRELAVHPQRQRHHRVGAVVMPGTDRLIPVGVG